MYRIVTERPFKGEPTGSTKARVCFGLESQAEVWRVAQIRNSWQGEPGTQPHAPQLPRLDDELRRLADVRTLYQVTCCSLQSPAT